MSMADILGGSGWLPNEDYLGAAPAPGAAAHAAYQKRLEQLNAAKSHNTGASMLALAGPLLEAGGQSTQPTSIGQAFGRGVPGMLQQMRAGPQQYLQNQVASMKLGSARTAAADAAKLKAAAEKAAVAAEKAGDFKLAQAIRLNPKEWAKQQVKGTEYAAPVELGGRLSQPKGGLGEIQPPGMYRFPKAGGGEPQYLGSAKSSPEDAPSLGDLKEVMVPDPDNAGTMKKELRRYYKKPQLAGKQYEVLTGEKAETALLAKYDQILRTASPASKEYAQAYNARFINGIEITAANGGITVKRDEPPSWQSPPMKVEPDPKNPGRMRRVVDLTPGQLKKMNSKIVPGTLSTSGATGPRVEKLGDDVKPKLSTVQLAEVEDRIDRSLKTLTTVKHLQLLLRRQGVTGLLGRVNRVKEYLGTAFSGEEGDTPAMDFADGIEGLSLLNWRDVFRGRSFSPNAGKWVQDKLYKGTGVWDTVPQAKRTLRRLDDIFSGFYYRDNVLAGRIDVPKNYLPPKPFGSGESLADAGYTPEEEQSFRAWKYTQPLRYTNWMQRWLDGKDMWSK